MSKRITIALTGGLGNQLFQLAAALHYAGDGKVQLLTEPGKPRVSKDGKPEIFSLKLPKNVEILGNGHFGWLFSKVIGFNLRSGLQPTKIESFASPLIRFISSFTLFLLTGNWWKVVASDNLGFPADLKIGRSTLLIGYFQTEKYINEIGVNNFISFQDHHVSLVEEYRALAEIEKPLVMHVRLGDYRGEDEIGILSGSYYRQNCDSLLETKHFGKIWLFSDEPIEAAKLIERRHEHLVRVVNSNHLSSAETLEIMTFGYGYLIANSSFGWWGAYLTKSAHPLVLAPTPWFKKIAEPRNLIPKEWMRASGFDCLE